MATSVKIKKEQETEINKLLEDKELRYHSKNDFVVKAVDNELRIASFKNRLDQSGKWHFDLLYNDLLIKAYERAMAYMYEEIRKTWVKEEEERKEKTPDTTLQDFGKKLNKK